MDEFEKFNKEFSEKKDDQLNEVIKLGNELFLFLDEYKEMDRKRIAIEDKIKKFMMDNKIEKMDFDNNKSLIMSSRLTKKLDESKIPEEHKHYIKGKMYIMTKKNTITFQ